MDETGDAPDDATTTHTAVSEPRADIDAAATIGRFAVLGSIGAGGMGQVFSAYDPQLDRRVALKLLHGIGNAVERQRLIREAQALARLSHPNVVTVHDVGDHGGCVFVAMEFVEGTTLRDWIDANPPGGRERLVRALELLLDAGRGIAAAHAAGLVHRDIKPRNILVGNDGRVRVVDFGLARSTGPDPEDLVATERPKDLARASIDESSGSALLGATLTESDKIVGTPAYMAPEQFERGPTDHAADQFAFCVTAWETLFGVRPFGGTTIAMLMAIRGRKLERPEGVTVPAAVEAALRRGLAPRPEQRHRDLAALLTVLADALAVQDGRPRPSRRRRTIVATLLGGTAIVGAFWLGARDDGRCDGAAAHFDGVWDAARKTEIEAAVRGTDASFAAGVWSRLERNVDGWRDAWISGFRDACEAAQVRGEQSTHLMDLRMACLDARHQRLVAYLDLLAAATVEIVATADEGFATLPSIERCADVEYVEHRGQRSDDPEIAAVEDAVLSELARASSLQAAGDYEGALAIARTEVARAEPSAWARAHARLAEGTALAQLHRPGAVTSLEDAYALARQADAGDVAARAAELLTRVLGVLFRSVPRSETWLLVARAEVDRGKDPLAAARLDMAEAELRTSEGNAAGARQALDAALALLESAGADTTLEYASALRVRSVLPDSPHDVADAEGALDIATGVLGPDHPSLVAFHRSMCEVLRIHGHLDAAAEHAVTALDIGERAFGPNNPRIAAALLTLAHVEDDRGNVDEALAHVRRAIAVASSAGWRDPSRAITYEKEAGLLVARSDLDAAAVALRTALDLFTESFGERDSNSARVMIQLGAVERRLGSRAAGTERMRLGLALAEESLGPAHPDVAVVYDAFAVEALRDGNLEEAHGWTVRARDLVQRVYGAGTLPTFEPEVNLCESAQALGNSALAIDHCRRAMTIANTKNMQNPLVLAALENNYGAALVLAEQYAEAEPHFERAASLWSKASGKETMQVALAVANLAEVRLRLDDPERALDLYSRSLATRTALAGPSNPILATPLLGISSASLALGDPGRARRSAEKALEILATFEGEARLVARAKEALALALLAPPSATADRNRARTLMREALDAFASLGPSSLRDTARIAAWLEDR